MSLILPSTAAPAPSANPGSSAALRPDEASQNNSGSFGEALASALAPAGEKTDQAVTKAAPAQPARRQAGPQKNEAEDLANAMALSFVPMEIRMPRAELPAGTEAASAAPADSALPASSAAALLAKPGSALPASSTQDLLASPGRAAPAASAAALLTALPSGISAAAGGPAEARGLIADTDAQPQLATVLAAASPKSAGQTPLPASLAAVSDGAAIQIEPLAVAAQTKAANTGLSDQSSRRDDQGANPLLSRPSAARADLTPRDLDGSQKVAAGSAGPGTETAALSVNSSPIAADAPVSASATLPMSAAAAALQAPGGVAAPNAPSPVASASLVPELGSQDWGKALGQQMIHMGNAGHQVAELQLNPPGLGPLKVTLSMNDHQMQAMFVSAHSSVRAAVEAALPQLRTTLADSGISLGNTSVGAESQQQQQTAFADSQNSRPQSGTYRRIEMAEAAALVPAGAGAEPTRRGGGQSIDTYA